MATPAQLVRVVSEATGVPLATVTDIDRKLAGAGLRSKGGRGRSAARMTPLDAAQLLTGVLASTQANLVAEAVSRYALARADKSRSSEGLFGPAHLDDLAALRLRHAFVQGLEAVIASALDGSIRRQLDKARQGRQLHIEVFAFTRATWGRIRLSAPTGKIIANVEYRLPGKESHAAASGDLEQSRRITGRTILAVADILREEPSHA